ncbi:hypothetical protein Tco_0393826 [Tanacetum coccineum]
MRDIGRLKTKRELVRITIDDGNAFWKEIGDNADVDFEAARHTHLAVRHKLMLPGITYYCWAKIVNEERQIQALVDKKKVIITKTSIRSDLKLDDAEGIDCLPTASIFAKLERMGTMASAMICLATNQTFNFSKYIFDNLMKHLEGGVKFLMYPRFVQVFLDKQVEGMTRHKGVYVTPSHAKKVFANMKRPCKAFSGRVTILFSTMMGRKIEDLDVDAEVSLVDETQEMNDDNLMFDTGVLEEQGIEFEKVVEEPVVSVATTTMSIPIKNAKPKPVITAATTVTSVRPRAKGIIFHDQEEQVPASIKIFSSSQSQLPQVKEKGKGKMVEPEVPLNKKDQVDLDEEMARNLEAQLQAELIEEERLTRQKEKEANIALIES